MSAISSVIPNRLGVDLPLRGKAADQSLEWILVSADPGLLGRPLQRLFLRVLFVWPFLSRMARAALPMVRWADG